MIASLQPESRVRKQIAFDLSQKALAEHYPKPADSINPQFYKKAYEDIAHFMEQNGFEHRQFSVYASKEKISAANVAVLVKSLAKEMPWLSDCVKQIDVADIGEQYSLTNALRAATNIYKKNLEHEQRHSRSVAQDELSMDSIMAKLNPIEKKQKQEHTAEQEFEC